MSSHSTTHSHTPSVCSQGGGAAESSRTKMKLKGNISQSTTEPQASTSAGVVTLEETVSVRLHPRQRPQSLRKDPFGPPGYACRDTVQKAGLRRLPKTVPFVQEPSTKMPFHASQESVRVGFRTVREEADTPQDVPPTEPTPWLLRKRRTATNTGTSSTTTITHGEMHINPKPVENSVSSSPKSQPFETDVQTERTTEQYVAPQSTHQVGRSFQPIPVKKIRMPPLSPPTTDRKRAQLHWLHIMHTTSSADAAWEAYSALEEESLRIPYAVLHRTVRLLSQMRPMTYTEYERILTLLKRLRAAGGTVHLHEWNILINAAGRGLRKTPISSYHNALSFFRDMTKGYAPGTTLQLESLVGSDSEALGTDSVTVEPVQPDIYTYTTLIAAAARTRDPKCMHHAKSLLERSPIAPNRITHLALMKYFSDTDQHGSVRSTVLRLEHDRMELGLDGLNALLLAYSKRKRIDVVLMIYHILRHNLAPGSIDGLPEEIRRLEEYRRRLRIEELLDVPDHLVPNAVTYTSMVQILAYHGRLSATLAVFADMITTLNKEPGTPFVYDEGGKFGPPLYQPTIHVFRSIFLGFRHHGVKPRENAGTRRRRTDTDSSDEPDWTLDNLQQMFQAFMRMPAEMQVGRSLFYWIMVAFQTTSGGDVELLRDVWKRLEERFDDAWGTPNNRLLKMRAQLFPNKTQSKPS